MNKFTNFINCGKASMILRTMRGGRGSDFKKTTTSSIHMLNKWMLNTPKKQRKRTTEEAIRKQQMQRKRNQ